MLVLISLPTCDSPTIYNSFLLGCARLILMGPSVLETVGLGEKTLKQQFPKIYVAPALFIAATDSRHYRHLTENIYRFTPYWMQADDRERIHGINERISLKNYKNYVEFFMKCIEAAGQDQTP